MVDGSVKMRKLAKMKSWDTGYVSGAKIPVFPLPTEILGALISVVSIWIVTGALVYLAIERIVRNDYEIEGQVMLVTSGCAVIVNIM